MPFLPLSLKRVGFDAIQKEDQLLVFLFVLHIISMMKAFAITNLIEVVMLILVLSSSRLRRGCLRSFSHLTVKLLFAFWLWVVFATLWGDSTISEKVAEVSSWRKILLVPLIIFLFKEVSARSFVYISFIVVSGLFLVASLVIEAAIIQTNIESRQVLENHATQGIIFSLSALLILAYLAENWGSLSAVFRSAAAIAASLYIFNIFFITTGRSGYLAAIVLGLCFPIVLFRNSPKRVILGLVIMVVASLSIFALSDLASNRVAKAIHEVETAFQGSQESSSMGMRMQMWSISSELIASKPILGSGSGSFAQDFEREAKKKPVYWIAKVSDDPHNQFLLIAAEQGLVGLFLFISTLGSVFVAVLRFVRISAGVNNSRIVSELLYLTSGLFFFCVSSLFNGHFGSFVEGRCSWIIVGLCIAIVSTVDQRSLRQA